jgi:hypothetical protein
VFLNLVLEETACSLISTVLERTVPAAAAPLDGLAVVSRLLVLVVWAAAAMAMLLELDFLELQILAAVADRVSIRILVALVDPAS